MAAWLYRSIKICIMLLITVYNTFGDVMFVANQSPAGIYASNFSLSDTNLHFYQIASPLYTKPYALDYDPYTSTVYYSDQFWNEIIRYLDGKNIIFLPNVYGVQGIAVDGIGQKLYWTSTADDRIEVVNLNISERTVLIDTGLSDPRDIELDLTNRYLYWTDLETKKIERAHLDDVNKTRTPVITIFNATDGPTGLVLSVPDGKMYWCVVGSGYIEEANLDGSNRREIGRLGYSNPHPYDLDIYKGYLYGTDESRIFRLNIGDGNVTVVSEGSLSQPRGIHIEEDPCSLECQNNGECIKKDDAESCACPYGFTGATCQIILGYCPCP